MLILSPLLLLLKAPVLIDEETLPGQPHQSVRILIALPPTEYGIATRECMRNSSEYKAATMAVCQLTLLQYDLQIETVAASPVFYLER